jgi:hypothetical protein
MQASGSGPACGYQLESPHQKGSLKKLNRKLIKGLGGIQKASAAFDHQHQRRLVPALADRFPLGQEAGLGRGWLKQLLEGIPLRTTEFHRVEPGGPA